MQPLRFRSQQSVKNELAAASTHARTPHNCARMLAKPTLALSPSPRLNVPFPPPECARTAHLSLPLPPFPLTASLPFGSLPRSLTHPLTYPLTHSLTHSLTSSLTHSLFPLSSPLSCTQALVERSTSEPVRRYAAGCLFNAVEALKRDVATHGVRGARHRRGHARG
eukprot:1241181-Pleurochrysis_carterae.AAC.1